jgi:hypothetical protein
VSGLKIVSVTSLSPNPSQSPCQNRPDVRRVFSFSHSSFISPFPETLRHKLSDPDTPIESVLTEESAFRALRAGMDSMIALYFPFLIPV